jgi:hypothetical protein
MGGRLEFLCSTDDQTEILLQRRRWVFERIARNQSKIMAHISMVGQRAILLSMDNLMDGRSYKQCPSIRSIGFSRHFDLFLQEVRDKHPFNPKTIANRSDISKHVCEFET